MRNYFEVIEVLGHEMFNNLMQGSMFPTFSGGSIVCFIYGVKSEQLKEDVKAVFNRYRDEYTTRTKKRRIGGKKGQIKA